MKKPFLLGILLVVLTIAEAQTRNNDYIEYRNLLDKLKNNYTLLLEKGEMESKYYFESYKINMEQHSKLYLSYLKACQQLLELDKPFVQYLISLSTEKRVNRSSWIKTVNPLRSDTFAFYTLQEEVLILIDHFLKGDNRNIEEPIYLDKLNLRKIKKFVRKNKNSDLTELREEYKKWLIYNVE